MDDKDLEEFPNLYQFTISRDGLNSPLWARQLYACLTVMHELCVPCSNPKYAKHIKDVPVGMKAEEFPEHFQILEHGVCPKCGKTKLDLFKSGHMNAYQELAGLAGQRVGKSLIVAACSTYLTHKTLKLQNPSKVYGILNTTLVGTFVGLTYDAAYQQLWLPYSNFIANSPWFCIEENTLISMADGSEKPIGQMSVGDEVKTLEGTSTVDHVFDNGIQDVWELELEDGTVLQATASHKVRCIDAESKTYWKTVGDLTDEDYVVCLE